MIVSYFLAFLLFWAPLCLVAEAKMYFFGTQYNNNDVLASCRPMYIQCFRTTTTTTTMTTTTTTRRRNSVKMSPPRLFCPRRLEPVFCCSRVCSCLSSSTVCFCSRFCFLFSVHVCSVLVFVLVVVVVGRRRRRRHVGVVGRRRRRPTTSSPSRRSRR